MCERFTTLQCKEVINVADGRRLGYVRDLEVETEAGRILSLRVPCPGRFFGLLPSREVYVIPWGCIRQIGADLILVEVCPDQLRRPREKKPQFL